MKEDNKLPAENKAGLRLPGADPSGKGDSLSVKPYQPSEVIFQPADALRGLLRKGVGIVVTYGTLPSGNIKTRF